MQVLMVAVYMLRVGAEAQKVGHKSTLGVIKDLTPDETCPGGMAKIGLVGTRSGLKRKTRLSDCTMVIQHHLKTACPITIGQR